MRRSRHRFLQRWFVGIDRAVIGGVWEFDVFVVKWLFLFRQLDFFKRGIVQQQLQLVEREQFFGIE
jgi:hypothetical protein